MRSDRFRWTGLLVVAVMTAGLACSPTPDTSGWGEYRVWVQSDWVVDLTQDIARWNASSTGSDAEVLASASALVDDLTPAIAWLDAHPPEACYTEAYRLNREWMVQMRSSLTGMGEAYETRDTDALYAGMRLMAESLRTRATAKEAHQAVRC